jgi:hypothetical protein
VKIEIFHSEINAAVYLHNSFNNKAKVLSQMKINNFWELSLFRNE